MVDSTAASKTTSVPPRGATLWQIAVPDASELHPSGFGPGTLHVAARGNVVLLEHVAGIVAIAALIASKSASVHSLPKASHTAKIDARCITEKSAPAPVMA